MSRGHLTHLYTQCLVRARVESISVPCDVQLLTGTCDVNTILAMGINVRCMDL